MEEDTKVWPRALGKLGGCGIWWDVKEVVFGDWPFGVVGFVRMVEESGKGVAG